MPRSNRARNPKKTAVANALHAVSAETIEGELNLPSVAKPESRTKDTFEDLDLPQVTSRELSRWIQYSSGMLSYVLVCLADAENKIDVVSGILAAKRATKAVLYRTDKMPKWELDAYLDGDTEIAKLEEKLVKLRAYKTLTKAHAQVWESRYSMFSRELSRRASERDQKL